jgi:hypothetical protein
MNTMFYIIIILISIVNGNKSGYRSMPAASFYLIVSVSSIKATNTVLIETVSCELTVFIHRSHWLRRYRTRITILPRTLRLSLFSCALAVSSKGNTESIITFKRSSSTKRAILPRQTYASIYEKALINMQPWRNFLSPKQKVHLNKSDRNRHKKYIVQRVVLFT